MGSQERKSTVVANVGWGSSNRYLFSSVGWVSFLRPPSFRAPPPPPSCPRWSPAATPTSAASRTWRAGPGPGAGPGAGATEARGASSSSCCPWSPSTCWGCSRRCCCSSSTGGSSREEQEQEQIDRGIQAGKHVSWPFPPSGPKDTHTHKTKRHAIGTECGPRV